MTIRSTVVVGILVLGSGAFALAQGIGFPFPGPAQRGGTHTTLSTPPIAGRIPSDAERYVCRLANVGNAPLSGPNIKIFDRHGQEIASLGDCGSSLQSGHVCENNTLGIPLGHDDDPDQSTGHVAYCKISFVGDSDNARGALQGTTLLDGVYEPGPVVDAR